MAFYRPFAQTRRGPRQGCLSKCSHSHSVAQSAPCEGQVQPEQKKVPLASHFPRAGSKGDLSCQVRHTQCGEAPVPFCSEAQPVKEHEVCWLMAHYTSPPQTSSRIFQSRIQIKADLPGRWGSLAGKSCAEDQLQACWSWPWRFSEDHKEHSAT